MDCSCKSETTSVVNLDSDINKLLEMIKLLRKENKLQNKKLRALCRRIECLEQAQFGHINGSQCSTTSSCSSDTTTTCTSSSCNEIDKLQTKLDNLYKITFNNQTCSKNNICNKC